MHGFDHHLIISLKQQCNKNKIVKLNYRKIQTNKKKTSLNCKFISFLSCNTKAEKKINSCKTKQNKTIQLVSIFLQFIILFYFKFCQFSLLLLRNLVRIDTNIEKILCVERKLADTLSIQIEFSKAALKSSFFKNSH